MEKLYFKRFFFMLPRENPITISIYYTYILHYVYTHIYKIGHVKQPRKIK